MSTRRDQVQTGNGSQDLANLKPGDTFIDDDGAKVTFEGWNADGSANMSDADGSFILIPVAPGTPDSFEYGGKWWTEK